MTYHTLESAKAEVGMGWHSLLERIFAQKPKSIKIDTVKEKFGGLRVYYMPYNKKFDDVVIKAEVESLTICEDCGKPGKLTEGSWIRTLCSACNDKFQKRKL